MYDSEICKWLIECCINAASHPFMAPILFIRHLTNRLFTCLYRISFLFSVMHMDIWLIPKYMNRSTSKEDINSQEKKNKKKICKLMRKIEHKR